MRLTTLETLRLRELPNLIWVRLHTDEGIIGLGETFFGAAAVETYLHDYVAPLVLGEDPAGIGAIARRLRSYLGHRGSGVETRGNSAIDIALWDLAGKRLGCPIHQLLGGAVRDSIRAYNTCAGTGYTRAAAPVGSGNWALDAGGSYDDLRATLECPEELAQSLLAQGIDAMKIWPFDRFAEASDGLHISASAMRQALEPFDRIRRAVGDRIDIMVEFHGLWSLPAAVGIARALEPYATYWHEDPVRMDSLSSLASYAHQSRAPVCASELLSGSRAFRDVIEAGVRGIAMLDVAWCGGVTEAHRIAGIADTWDLPVTFHDCTGPVVLTAATHLALAEPNALVQEMVRAFYYGWYRELVTALPTLDRGHLSPPAGPGLGLELDPGVWHRADAVVRTTAHDS